MILMAKMLVIPETELHYKWPNIEVIETNTKGRIRSNLNPMQTNKYALHMCKLEGNKTKEKLFAKNKVHTTNVTSCFHYY